MVSTERLLAGADDEAALRSVFAAFPSGVAAVAAEVDGVPEILVASSFQVGISMAPPMVLFAVQNSSTTWPVLGGAARFGISVLATGHSGLIRQLAGKDRAARLAGVATSVQPGGAVLLEEASVWFECELTHDYPAGDHRLIVFTVLATSADDHQPLVFHRSAFHGLAPIL